MAVNSSPLESELVLVMENGTGTKTRRYSNVKSNADNEAVYLVAQSLASLQDKTMLAVQRRDMVHLYNE